MKMYYYNIFFFTSFPGDRGSGDADDFCGPSHIQVAGEE